MPQSWLVYDSNWINPREPLLGLYVMLWDKKFDEIYLEQVPLEANQLKGYGGGYWYGGSGCQIPDSNLERQADGSWIQTSNDLEDGQPDRIITYHFLTLELYQYHFPKMFGIDFRSTEDLQAFMVKHNAEEYGIK